MSLNNLTGISGIAIFSSIGLFYNHVKTFVLKIIGFVIKNREVPVQQFSNIFYCELIKYGRFLPLDDYTLSTNSFYSLKNEIYLPVYYKEDTFQIFLYRNFIPIFIKGGHNGILVKYIKFTFNFEKFLEKAQNIYHKEMIERETRRSNFWIKLVRGKSLKYKLNSVARREEPSKLEGNYTGNTPPSVRYVILPPKEMFDRKINKFIGMNFDEYIFENLKAPKERFQETQIFKELSNQLEKWIKAEKWFNERGIPHKRSVLLHGPPGNGKSSIVLSLARKFKIPIYIFDLSSLDNQEFDEQINEMVNDCGIILFEDIDNCFEFRTNLNKSNEYGGLTFGHFINRLSGVETIKGKFIFSTTNFLKNLDSALLRDGRMDEILEISPLNQYEKNNLANIILDNRQDLVQKMMENSENESTATFENKCIRCALENFWKN